MKSKPFRSLLTAVVLVASALAFTGCQTGPKLSPALVSVAVSTGVSLGVDKYPQTIPFIRAATPVVCAAANSTNIEPAQVVAALESSGVIDKTNTTARLILNGALAVYITVFDNFGENWVNSKPELQSYLKAVCDGLTTGVPPAGLMAPLHRKPLPPHL